MIFLYDLQSFGYIVIAVEHEDGSAMYARPPHSQAKYYTPVPENLVYKNRHECQDFRRPMLDQRVADVEAILSAIEKSKHASVDPVKYDTPVHQILVGILRCTDSCKVHLMGHSFGGAATLRASLRFRDSIANSSLDSDDVMPTIKSRVVLDLWPYPLPDEDFITTSLPSLFIGSQTFYDGNEVELTKTIALLSGDGTQAQAQAEMEETEGGDPARVNKEFLARYDDEYCTDDVMKLLIEGRVDAAEKEHHGTAHIQI